MNGKPPNDKHEAALRPYPDQRAAHLAFYARQEHANLIRHLQDVHGLDRDEFPMSRTTAKNRHRDRHTDNPAMPEYIGVALSHGTAALQYLQTPDGWAGFTRWLAATADPAGPLVDNPSQLNGAEIILAFLALRFLGATAGEIAGQTGHDDKVIAHALRDMRGGQPPC